MTRDEAIEAGARALFDADTGGALGAWSDPGWPNVKRVKRAHVAAVLDAIGWAEPVGYLAAEPGALIGAYPSYDEAARSGWGDVVYAVVPVEGASKLGANS